MMYVGRYAVTVKLVVLKIYIHDDVLRTPAADQSLVVNFPSACYAWCALPMIYAECCVLERAFITLHARTNV